MEFYESEKELKAVLINEIIPFVNAKQDSAAAIELFVEANAGAGVLERERAVYLAEHGEPMPKWALEGAASILNQRAQHLRGKPKEIKELQYMLKTMLVIAFRGEKGQPIEDIPSGSIRALETKLNEIYKRPEAKWRGIEGNYVINSLQGERLDPFFFAAGRWFNCVAVLFKLLPGFDGKPEILGAGYSVAGMCPNCRIFFAKKRRDQGYCSRNCQVVASNRQRRNLKKK